MTGNRAMRVAVAASEQVARKPGARGGQRPRRRASPHSLGRFLVRPSQSDDCREPWGSSFIASLAAITRFHRRKVAR